jgi:NADPH:quinone reductase
LGEIAGADVREALRAGAIRGDVRHRYPLAAAAEAHRDLESRRSTGSLVLLP